MLQDGAIGAFGAAIEDGDVVQAKKTAFEQVVAFAVDLVDPPGEIDEQLVKAFLEKRKPKWD